MRSGTFGSGVEFAAAGGLFEQEEITARKPAANRVIRIFLMSIFRREGGNRLVAALAALPQEETTWPLTIVNFPAVRDPRKRKTRDLEMPRVSGFKLPWPPPYRGA
jgi:hypothetical protein